MKKIFFLTISFIFAFNCFSQEISENSNPIQHYRGAIGISAGTTTGLGLTGIYFSGRFGVQLAALPVKTSNLIFVSAALTGYYLLKETRFFNTYLYLGNNVVYQDKKDLLYYNPVEQSEKVTEYNIGFGAGFIVGRQVAFRFMGGYGVYDVTNTVNFYPAVELGLFYRF
jgi:hypothetical protein